MQLIGYMDSPFVRRVAISLEFFGIEYDHRELSIFRDFDEFHAINPLVKVPTLVLDNGQVLVDSTLIIDYLEKHVAGTSLTPGNAQDHQRAAQYIGVALVAMEKLASLIYETGHRPPERQYQPWVDRLRTQLKGAIDLMESTVKNRQGDWLLGNEICQADITTAVAWRFSQHIDASQINPDNYPAMVEYSRRAENLPEFLACPLSE
jgi:glutathione S-transferase